jgi:uncharacterized membrane protein
MPQARPPMRSRREYLDWLRGAAVLLMIEAHITDSWTRYPDRETALFGLTVIIGGMGSVFFLVLAGTAVALSAGSKWRRSGDHGAAAGAVVQHGLLIFALAFLFRIQEWILGGFPNPRDLLKVDILNIMGPSIVITGLLWLSVWTTRARCAVFAAATGLTTFLTPLIRLAPLGFLPDPIEAYVVPLRGLNNFVFFPWMGFVFAGAFVGVLLDADVDRRHEPRLVVWIAAAGALIGATSYVASMFPSPFQGSSFWTSSPSFFFIRVAVAMVALALAYGWMVRPRRPDAWSPMVQLGQTSLFIYWIHVELVYGVLSNPLRQALSLWQVLAANVVFACLMLLCSVRKDQAVERYRARRTEAAAAA